MGRSTRGIRHTKWNASMDAQLRAIFCTMPLTEVAKEMGLTVSRCRARARQMGLPNIPIKKSHEPSRQEWIDAARQAAKEAEVSHREILVGERKHRVARARWRAFQAILEQNPKLSVAGVGRISGFDHTTILHGLKRLEELRAA